MGDTFKKSKGNTGIEGLKFQLNLLTVFLLNALRNHKEWKISTENEEAGKYDDVVLELPEKSVLLQAKYKKNKNISREQFFSSVKNADFSLAKYFFSYHEIKTNFTNKILIICTNTGIYDKDLKHILVPRDIDHESMLFYEGASCSIFTLNANILPDLKASINDYYKKNLEGKGTDKTIITEGNVKDFLKNLQIYSNYPSGDKLQEVTETLLTRLNFSLYYKVSGQEIYNKVEDWFKQLKGEYLTEERAKAMFSEIKSDKYCEKLKNYGVSFKLNNLNFPYSKKIFHISSEGRHLLQALKIYDVLQKDRKKLFVDPFCDAEVQEQIIDAFTQPRYTFLILFLTEVTETVIRRMSGKLRNALKKKYKKVVLVSDGKNNLLQQIGLTDIMQMNGLVKFTELSEDTQEKLVQQTVINFQGRSCSLKKLLEPALTEDYSKAVDFEILENLITQKEIKVGMPLLNLNECISWSYIDRKFRREYCKTGNRPRSNVSTEECLPEGSICDWDEKVILIANSAGMGKSTVLSKLAISIKDKFPYLWVIRINLDHYEKVLTQILKYGRDTVSVTELLNYNNATKLKNQLERFIFSKDKKVVMMIDGVDEISSNLTDLILSMLGQCYRAANLAKLFVTTRPHLIRKLEKTLKVSAFILHPFTQNDQVEFLTKYWMTNLQLNNKDKDKCEQYARALVNKISSWTKTHNNYNKISFTSVPLHIRMIAEIFAENELQNWEGCKQYLKGGNRTCLIFPEKMEFTKLYKMFIKKKRDVFVYKGSPNVKSTANRALVRLFNESLMYHRSLAMEVVIGGSKCNMFSTYVQCDEVMEEDLLDIGIVHSLDGRLHFIHRIFAEYFFAESLVKELQNSNQNVDFQRFLIEKIFWKPEFSLIRTFVDSFLLDYLSSLPFHVFDSYHSCASDSDVFWWIHNHNPIFILAEEGCVTILQLILKSVDFEVVSDKEVSVGDIRKHIHNWSAVTNIDKSNVLSALRILVEQGGLNIRDRMGCTPLHYAAQGGHLEMVKFLFDKGVKIDSSNYAGHTALHLAVWNDHLNIVKFLVEMQADVNIRDNKGSTPLHFAVSKDQFDIVEYLIKRRTDINITNRTGQTPLHLAALVGQLHIAKLLVENDVDVNTNDKYGRKALHVAALNGQLNILTYFMDIYRDINIKDNDGNTALHLAVLRNHLEIVIFLSRYRVDFDIVNNDGNAALHLASVNDNLDIVRYLVEQKSNIYIRSKFSRTALHLAALYGRLHTVRFLAQLDNTDINVTDDNGNTAVHVAALNGKLNTVKLLTELKANVNARDNCGRMTLHLAALSGQLDCAKFLVDLDIDVNLKDDAGNTALHLACWSGKFNTVKYIVEHGGDCNITDRYGRTTLHLAVLSGKLKIVKYLIDIGVEVDISDRYGRTALQLAEITEKIDIIKFFSNYNYKHQ